MPSMCAVRTSCIDRSIPFRSSPAATLTSDAFVAFVVLGYDTFAYVTVTGSGGFTGGLAAFVAAA